MQWDNFERGQPFADERRRKVQTVTSPWNVVSRYGEMGEFFFQILHNDPMRNTGITIRKATRRTRC